MKGKTAIGLTSVGLIVAMLAAMLPNVAAQATSGFGSQVVLGDADHVPTSRNAAAVAPTWVHIDFGVVGDVRDDCTYLETSGAGGGVSNYDIRMTDCAVAPTGANTPGSLVDDAANTEKNAAAGITTQPALVLQIADVNNNGRYDSGDYVYASTGAVGALAASTGPAAFSIRVTPVGTFAVGSYVFASDSDFTSYRTSTLAFPATISVAWFDKDLSAAQAFTPGDNAYLTSGSAALLPANSLFPINAIRVSKGNTAGAVGSQVMLDSSDYRPTSRNAAAVAPTWVHIDFGVVGDVRDDCTYLETSAAAGGVSNYDIRMTMCAVGPTGEQDVGSLVSDAANTEKNAAAGITTQPALVLQIADVNNNGRYDSGDYVYASTGAVAALAASTGPAAFSIRVTPVGTFAAGSYVFASDSDFTSYRTSTLAFPATISVAWFDKDLSAANAFTPGDNAYLTPGTAALLPANSLFPLNSIRVSKGNTAGAVGSQVILGNADHIPTSRNAVAIAPTWVHIDFGVVGDVRDDCTYLETSAAAGGVSNYDIRMTDCAVAPTGANTPGSLVDDAANTEKNAAAGITTQPALVLQIADINNNGRYDSGDGVYASTGAVAALAASTGPAAFSVRLTPMGTFAAGSYVFASDSDFTSYRTSTLAFPATISVAWFDKDLSAANAFTPGDSAYLSAGTAALLPANSLFPLNSLRVSGPPASAPPVTPPVTTPPVTTPPVTTPPVTTPPVTTPPVTTPPTSAAPPATTSKTPGFELVVLAAGAVVAALVISARRKA